MRRTPKPITNESVEKEISSFFKKKYTENILHERNLQEKIEFIRRIYLNHNHGAELSDVQKRQLRDLSGEKRSASNISRRSGCSAARKQQASGSRTRKHVVGKRPHVGSYLKSNFHSQRNSSLKGYKTVGSQPS